MKHRAWALALTVALTSAGDVCAQPILYPFDGGYYGRGIGFSYQGRRFSISGFLGGFSGPRYGAVYPISPYDLYLPRPLIERRVIIDLMPPPPPPRFILKPSLEDELAGIDLDLVPPKQKPVSPDLPPTLPGKDVSKPVPPVRPGDMPKPPPPKPPAPKGPDLSQPRDDPVEESARLVALGLRAFADQEYGLAAFRFRQATTVDPKGSRAHFLLAQAQFAVGKYHDSVAAIHAGMLRHKNWPRAPFQPRLDVYKGLEPEFVAHLKRLEKTHLQAPDNPTYLFLYAHQLWFDGRQLDAVPLFRRARQFVADKSFIEQFLAAAPPGPVAAN